MTPSLEGWPTKGKEAPSPHEVRLALLDTSPVFQSIGAKEEDLPLQERIHLPISEESSPFKRHKI